MHLDTRAVNYPKTWIMTYLRWANAELCVERINYFILGGNQKLLYDSWMCLSIISVVCYNNSKTKNFLSTDIWGGILDLQGWEDLAKHLQTSSFMHVCMPMSCGHFCLLKTYLKQILQRHFEPDIEQSTMVFCLFCLLSAVLLCLSYGRDETHHCHPELLKEPKTSTRFLVSCCFDMSQRMQMALSTA